MAVLDLRACDTFVLPAGGSVVWLVGLLVGLCVVVVVCLSAAAASRPAESPSGV